MNLEQVISITIHQLAVYMSIAELILAVPIAFVLKRLGFSPLWALLAFFPALGVPALYVLAFIRWPQSAQPQL